MGNRGPKVFLILFISLNWRISFKDIENKLTKCGNLEGGIHDYQH